MLTPALSGYGSTTIAYVHILLSDPVLYTPPMLRALETLDRSRVLMNIFIVIVEIVAQGEKRRTQRRSGGEVSQLYFQFF